MIQDEPLPLKNPNPVSLLEQPIVEVLY